VSSEKKTILIVDDEADARAFVETVVEETGDFTVLTAGDGDSAVETARAETPDLVILDVMMPGKDGFHVFYALRQNPATANTPVIMLTGVSEKTGVRFSEKDMDEFIGSSPIAFLDKPVSPGTLQGTIRKALAM
jgi:CheY-like chemotaxis protein